MTKEEKIKEVYQNLGFEWNICSKYITDNGVLILPTPDLKYSLKGYENIIKDENKFSAFGKEGLKLQPTELAGIYNNNGWTKIESEDDLPKIKGNYLVIDKFLETNPSIAFYDPKAVIFLMSSWYERYSHYQLIINPREPIY